MIGYIDKTARITEIEVDGYDEMYKIDIDNGRFKWGDLILERAVKIGTRVKIKDLPVCYVGNVLEYDRNNEYYAGQEATVVSYDESDDTYKLDVDNELWWWEDTFVDIIETNEELAPDTNSNDNNIVFALGDIVKVKEGTHAGTIGYINKINTVLRGIKRADLNNISWVSFEFSNLEKVDEEAIMNVAEEVVPETAPYEQLSYSLPVVKGSILKIPTRKTRGYSLDNTEDVMKAIKDNKKYIKATRVLTSGVVETNVGAFNQRDLEVLPTNFVVGHIEGGHRIKDKDGKTHTYEEYSAENTSQTLIEDNDDFIEYIDSTGWFVRVWKELVTKPRGVVEYTEYFALCTEDYITYKDQEEKRMSYLKSVVARKEAEVRNAKITNNKLSFRSIKESARRFLEQEAEKIRLRREKEERERILAEQNKYGIWKHHKDIWN
jgi:hypothetical protein